MILIHVCIETENSLFFCRAFLKKKNSIYSLSTSRSQQVMKLWTSWDWNHLLSVNNMRKGGQLVWVIHPGFSSKSFVVLSTIRNLVPQMACRMVAQTDAGRKQQCLEGGRETRWCHGHGQTHRLFISAISTRLPKTRVIASFDLWYGYNQGNPFFSGIIARQLLEFCFFSGIQALHFCPASQ